MTKYYVSIGSQVMFTTKENSKKEVIDYIYEKYKLNGFKTKREEESIIWFYTTYKDIPTQVSIAEEKHIDLEGWEESIFELYYRDNED